MSKSLGVLYGSATALLLGLVVASSTAVGGMLVATRATNGVWGGPGTRVSVAVDTAADWLAQQAAMHGAVILAAALAFALISLLLLLVMARHAFRRAPRLLLSRGTIGDVSVDLEQVGLLAQHEAERVTGVREVRTNASSTRSGLSVEQTVAVESEASFTTLAEQIQQRVKRSLEHHLGLPVATVRVLMRHTTLSRPLL